MALLFIDSLDHYQTSDLARKWTSNNSMQITTGGRNGGSRLKPLSGAATIHKTISGSGLATWYMGFAFDPVVLTSAQTMLTFQDAGAGQCNLLVNTDGTISARRGTTVLGTTASQVVHVGTWDYIEVKATINSVSGAILLKVNEIEVLNLTNVNTRGGSANNYATEFMFGASATAGGAWDDLYVDDAQFRGDCRIEALLPIGVGNSGQWTSSSGGANWTNVDDVPANDDVDYNYTATVDALDLYDMQNLSTDQGAIVGVQALALSRKDDAGARSIVNAVRTNGVNYFGDVKALGDNYVYHMKVWELNPNTGLVWSIAQVNAVECGMKLNA